MSELLKAPRIDGAKIAVVLENKFIPEEIAAYLNGFPLLGGEVELVSRLWYGDYKPASTTFYSDVDPSDDPVWASPQKIDVRRDISQVRPSDFDAAVMAANYTSVRLRYRASSTPGGTSSPRRWCAFSPTPCGRSAS
jgi:protease I